MTIRVLAGDCRHVLKTLPDGAARCCVTSPPYYWQRDYGAPDQIGLEQTPELYVSELVAVFREVMRVLADDGTLWLNLGDSYYSGNGQPKGSDPRSPSRNWRRQKVCPLDVGGWDIPKKSLLGIPWSVALALQGDGWTLRQEIIWARDSAFPEPSVQDRPHRQHETLFLLAKSRRYHFDRTALPEESVWHIPHRRGEGDHSAAFPHELPRRCILSSTHQGDTVLDPFIGSGTTAEVAESLGRNCIGIDANPAHADLSANRMPLFTEAA